MKKTIVFIAIIAAFGCKKAENKTQNVTAAEIAAPTESPLGESKMSKKDLEVSNALTSTVSANANSAVNSNADAAPKAVLEAAPVQHIVIPTSTYSTAFRKIVRTAQVKSKVTNTEQATYKIEQIARKFNGFVSETQLESRNLNQTDTPISTDSTLQTTHFEVVNHLVLRVPNARLDTFLGELSQIYTHLDFRRVNAQDLTAPFLTNQLKAQLRDNAAQRIAEATDEKGKRLSDITNAEESRVAMKDAAIEQHIQNLETDYDIAFSVVNLEIYQDALVSKAMKPNTNNVGATANFGFRLTQALANGWAILLDIFLFFINLWAFILLGLGAFWGFKKIKTAGFLPAKS
jgi:Domain of unknown function (DUF4349)